MSLFTASWSRRGGACSAQTFGAVACGGTAEGDAAAGAMPSAACVVALHLSSALRSLAVAGQCSGSCTPRSCQSWSGSCAMKCDRSAVLLYAYAKSAMLAMPSSKRTVAALAAHAGLTVIGRMLLTLHRLPWFGRGLCFELQEQMVCGCIHSHTGIYVGQCDARQGTVVAGVELTVRSGACSR